jgi:transposase-like protein
MFETELDRMVSEKVNEILNRMLDAEADEIAGAARYERSDGRKAYRAGHYERDLTVKAGKMAVRVPKLKGALFESAVIERYRRREESVEEALIDMYLAGFSTCLREGIGETTTYLLDDYPVEHRRRIRTNNMIERLNREIRRRTRVVGAFPDGRSALMLITARIRYVTGNDWSTRRYLDMSRLHDTIQEAN